MLNNVKDSFKISSTVSWPQFYSVVSDYQDFQYYDFDDLSRHSSLLNFYGLGSSYLVKGENDSMESEAYCFDPCYFAEKFVDSILIEALQKITQTQESKALNSEKLFSESVHSSSLREQIFTNILSTPKPDIVKWPKISEFNIKLGHEKLEAFVSQWERSDDWFYCVDFLGFECEDCSNIFVYEVEWSKPTMSYPIPQATASVYFGLEVSKIIPYSHDRPVQVSYVFECSNVIHVPGKIDFQEIWLQDILDAKLKFFRTITFSVPKGFCDTPSGTPENDKRKKIFY